MTLPNSTEQAIQDAATDATGQDEDRSTEQENEPSSDYVSPRMAALERVAETRRAALVADGVDVALMASDETPARADAGSKANSADDGKATSAADDQLAAQLAQDERGVSAEQRVRVKVDGEEIELPLAEVVRSYQKDATATRRLQEATRLLKIAQETGAEQQAIKTIAQENQSPENESSSAGDDGRKLRKEQVRGVFAKLYEGDEEGAAEAMAQLIDTGGATKATPQPAIDPGQIAAQVKQQLAVESAYSEVKSDYPELFQDTERGVVLGRETHARMVAKVAQGLTGDQALKQSAEEVATLFGISKQGRQTTAPQRTARDTKLERKAALDNVNAANVVAGNGNSPAEVQNVSSVIADMARARLGQSMSGRH